VHMVPSRYATKEELVELARAAGRHEGTSLELIPMVAPVFEPWAIELMVDLSVAAQRPLNWNVLTVAAASAAQTEAKLEAGDVARRRGAKVVALTIPHSFGVRLSFASGFVLDAMPGWEEAMLLPRPEKLRLFRDKAAHVRLNDLAMANVKPLRLLNIWSIVRLYVIIALIRRIFVVLSVVVIV